MQRVTDDFINGKSTNFSSKERYAFVEALSPALKLAVVVQRRNETVDQSVDGASQRSLSSRSLFGGSE
eukprot:scaffold2044_cov247-Pinguiococcus_pyrenoidosus.AAC.13